jgi:glycosyl transferase family 25
MRPKAFAISLARVPDRRESVLNEARKAGLDVEVVDAVDGKDYMSGDTTDYERMKQDYPFDNSNWGATFRASEIGCYHSHLKVFRLIMEQGLDYAFILEDDAVMTSCFSNTIDIVEGLASIPDWFYCCLHDELPGLNVNYDVIKSLRPLFFQVREAPLVTVAAVVSRRYCEYMLEHHLVMTQPIDHVICVTSKNPDFKFLQTKEPVYRAGDFATTML